MTEQMFPEIEAATKSIETRIAITEKEIADMKEAIGAKKNLLRSWRKALGAFETEPTAPGRKKAGK